MTTFAQPIPADAALRARGIAFAPGALALGSLALTVSALKIPAPVLRR